MSSNQRVALVTGANQGIGKSIVEQLLQRDNNLTVLLGSRNIDNGNKAVLEIQQKYKNINDRLHPIHIDLNDTNTIKQAADAVKQRYNGLDILINNAGWASKGPTINEKIAHDTQQINYYGTKSVIDTFLPIMKPHGRIVNVSSTSSAYALRDMSTEHKQQLLSDNLTIQQLEQLLTEFINSVKQDKIVEHGWPKSAYGMSKVGVSMLTKIYAKQHPELTINCGCPGYVKTNMSSYSENAPRTPDQGAQTFVDIALGEQGGKITGRLWYDSKPVEYTTLNM